MPGFQSQLCLQFLLTCTLGNSRRCIICLVSATHTHQEGVPCSCFHPGTAPVDADIWGINQVKDLCVYLPVSVPFKWIKSTSFKKLPSPSLNKTKVWLLVKQWCFCSWSLLSPGESLSKAWGSGQWNPFVDHSHWKQILFWSVLWPDEGMHLLSVTMCPLPVFNNASETWTWLHFRNTIESHEGVQESFVFLLKEMRNKQE